MLHTFYLGLLLCVAGSYALYDSSSSVVELTPSNFDNLVTKSDDVWIVEFYAPWCGHCKNLVPEYNKAAKALKGIIKVGAVDADSHQALAKKFGVSGYPTLKIFTGSKHTPYQGQRTAEAFVDAGIKAAKDKAYENLGKKSSGGSGDKSIKALGHRIPWKKIQRSEKPENRISKLQVNKMKLKTLQDLLFRGQNDGNIDVHRQTWLPKHLLERKPALKHVLRQKTAPKHALSQKIEPTGPQKSLPKHSRQTALSQHLTGQKTVPKHIMRQNFAPKHSIIHKNAPSLLMMQTTHPRHLVKQNMVPKLFIGQKLPRHSLRPKIPPNHSIEQKNVPKQLLKQKSVPKNLLRQNFELNHSAPQKIMPKNAMKHNLKRLDKLQASLFRRKFDEDISLNVRK